MQILVVSDSHEDIDTLRMLLEEYEKTAQLVIHLGDHDQDLLNLARVVDMPMLAVAGNTDDDIHSPTERICTFLGKKIFMTHGHLFNVNANYDSLMRKLLEEDADICLFGHTHSAATFTQHGKFFMNPGSISDPRDEKPPSYGVITLNEESGEVKGEIIYL